MTRPCGVLLLSLKAADMKVSKQRGKCSYENIWFHKAEKLWKNKSWAEAAAMYTRAIHYAQTGLDGPLPATTLQPLRLL